MIINLPNDVSISNSDQKTKLNDLYKSQINAMTNQTYFNFDTASKINAIYQNNGLICQNKMYNAMYGCDNYSGITICQMKSEYNKIFSFPETLLKILSILSILSASKNIFLIL